MDDLTAREWTTLKTIKLSVKHGQQPWFVSGPSLFSSEPELCKSLLLASCHQTTLTTLSLSNLPGLRDWDIPLLTALSVLESLDISRCRGITGYSLGDLSTMSNLNSLTMELEGSNADMFEINIPGLPRRDMVPQICRITRLQHLSLVLYTGPRHMCPFLRCLSHIVHLVGVDYLESPSHTWEELKSLQSLKSLRVDILSYHTTPFFLAVKQLPCLEKLEVNLLGHYSPRLPLLRNEYNVRPIALPVLTNLRALEVLSLNTQIHFSSNPLLTSAEEFPGYLEYLEAIRDIFRSSLPALKTVDLWGWDWRCSGSSSQRHMAWGIVQLLITAMKWKSGPKQHLVYSQLKEECPNIHCLHIIQVPLPCVHVLAGIRGLKSLTLQNPTGMWTEEWEDHSFTRLISPAHYWSPPQLQHVRLSDIPTLSLLQLQSLAENVHCLEVLEICDCPELSSGALPTIASITTLKELDLHLHGLPCAGLVSSTQLQSLVDLKHLQIFTARGSWIDCRHVGTLKHLLKLLPRLQTLDLSGCRWLGPHHLREIREGAHQGLHIGCAGNCLIGYMDGAHAHHERTIWEIIAKAKMGVRPVYEYLIRWSESAIYESQWIGSSALSEEQYELVVLFELSDSFKASAAKYKNDCRDTFQEWHVIRPSRDSPSIFGLNYNDSIHQYDIRIPDYI